jgi:hypothetical protein
MSVLFPKTSYDDFVSNRKDDNGCKYNTKPLKELIHLETMHIIVIEIEKEPK